MLATIAVVCSNECLKEVKTLCAYQEYPLLAFQVGEDINVSALYNKEKELEKVEKIVLEITDKRHGDLLDWVMNVKKNHANLQVILFFNNDIEIDNEYIKKLVDLEIYDLVKIKEKEEIQDVLYDAIVHPATERKARKWIKEEKPKEKEENINEDIEEIEYIPLEEYDIEEIEPEEQEEYEFQQEEYEEELEDEEEDDYEIHKEKRIPFQINMPSIQIPTIPKKEVIEKRITVVQEKIIGTIVIAIAGTQSRIGVTHTAIALAKYLSSQGYEVALAEAKENEIFTEIEAAYKDIKRIEKGYVLDGMTFYKKLDMSEILQRNHNYIILDLGTYGEDEFRTEEFNRATKKVLVSGSKDWEFKYLEKILGEVSTLYLESYSYLFNFCDQDTLEFIKQNMPGMNVLKTGYNPNPFEVTSEARESFQELLQEIVPQNASKKRKFFKKGN